MVEIRTSHESERGCGYRKGGGLYMVSGINPMRGCCRFPVPLEICPTCSGGIKPTRGFTWIDPRPLFPEADGGPECASCPFFLKLPERAGLIWIGGKFYESPEDWINEVRRMGVSRRIPAVPRDFEVGVTRIFVAHREAITTRVPVPLSQMEAEGWHIDVDRAEDCIPPEGTRFEGDLGYIFNVETGWMQVVRVPGIFHAFVPTAIEYVTTGKESEEELERIAARGIELVKVIPVDDEGHELIGEPQTSLFEDEEGEIDATE